MIREKEDEDEADDEDELLRELGVNQCTFCMVSEDKARFASCAKNNGGLHSFIKPEQLMLSQSQRYQHKGLETRRGGFGEAFPVSWSKARRTEFFCRKRFFGDMKQENMLTEAQMLKTLLSLHHEHLPRFIALDKTDCSLTSYPWCNYTFEEVFKECSTDDVLWTFKCMSTTVFTVHGLKVKHRDINPPNMAFIWDRENVLKSPIFYLLDFGLARKFQTSQEAAVAYGGKQCFKVPEGRASEVADVFCCGLSMIDALRIHTEATQWTLEACFRSKWTQKGIDRLLEQARVDVANRAESLLSVLDIIQEMVVVDPKKRLTAWSMVQRFLKLSAPSEGSGCSCWRKAYDPMDTNSSIADFSIHNEEEEDEHRDEVKIYTEEEDERKLKVDDLVDLVDDFEPDELGLLIQKLQEKKRQLEEERNNNNNDNNQEKRIKME